MDLAKKGYEIVKDELSSNPKKKKHLQHEASSSPKVEKSSRTEVVIVPTKQTPWGKKWDALKTKVKTLRYICAMSNEKFQWFNFSARGLGAKSSYIQASRCGC